MGEDDDEFYEADRRGTEVAARRDGSFNRGHHRPMSVEDDGSLDDEFYSMKSSNDNHFGQHLLRRPDSRGSINSQKKFSS